MSDHVSRSAALRRAGAKPGEQAQIFCRDCQKPVLVRVRQTGDGALYTAIRCGACDYARRGRRSTGGAPASDAAERAASDAQVADYEARDAADEGGRGVGDPPRLPDGSAGSLLDHLRRVYEGVVAQDAQVVRLFAENTDLRNQLNGHGGGAGVVTIGDRRYVLHAAPPAVPGVTEA